MVVGQELTDSDKGLDDGIEGEIFGFNLIGESEKKKTSSHSSLPYSSELLPHTATSQVICFPTKEIAFVGPKLKPQLLSNFKCTSFKYSQFSNIIFPNRRNDGERRRRILYLPQNNQNYLSPAILGANSMINVNRFRFPSAQYFKAWPISSKIRFPVPNFKNNIQGDVKKRFSEDNRREDAMERLALQSFLRCTDNRGSPWKGNPNLLISWPNSPVKVFGGAMISPAKRICGQF